MNRIYMCIDLKSFYASVECVERGLDPNNTNLVVADKSRTEKTICLAVTPSLKKYGISGRARLFEVVQKVNEINYFRKMNNPEKEFKGSSYIDSELMNNPTLKLDYIAAPPRMSYYMKYSTDIYNIYLKYFSQEDIYVYSVDEVFCDITTYLKLYNMSPEKLATKIVLDVYNTTGITATVGIGTNMYLAKVAMDVGAKHVNPNKEGVRICKLDVMSYRQKMWTHRPLNDFWRIGVGYVKKLEKNGMYTLGDIARCSIENEDLLYKLFGVNAELLIDHVWGYEPCTIKDVKSYKPTTNSLSSGQVLHSPYDYDKTKLIVKEMTELLTLELVDRKLVTNQIVLTIGYDIENLKNEDIKNSYNGEIKVDRYGRKIPKHAHGTINLESNTSSTKLIVDKTLKLFDKIINKNFLVRRINVVANNLEREDLLQNEKRLYEQLNLFINYDEVRKKEKIDQENRKKEKNLQHAIIDIKKKYGKNAILKGMNFLEGGTTIQRNGQIGGHKG